MAAPDFGTEGIYLDHNATTPVDPRVFEALTPFLQWRFGNPSSKHDLGHSAAAAVREARVCVAKVLGAPNPECIVFTSGATESINWALRSAAKLGRKAAGQVRAIITSALEHPAAWSVCKDLGDNEGYSALCCPTTSYGLVDLVQFEALLSKATVLISIPLANGEIGSVQPIKEIVSVSRRVCPEALIHVDASQALGKVPVNVSDLGVDLLTVAGHKVYAPKGIGALYIREGLQLPPLLLGGGQERGLRGGTENVAFIVAFAKACELVGRSWEAPEVDCTETAVAAAISSPPQSNAGEKTSDAIPHPSHLAFTAKIFLEAFWRALESKTGKSREQLATAVRFNGPLGSNDPALHSHWLGGTIHLSVRDADGPQIARELAEQEKLFVSAGVSCHQGKVVSLALDAMGQSAEWALGSLRISTGRRTSVIEAVTAAGKLAKYLFTHQLIPTV